LLAARVEVAPQTVELIGRELTAALDEARSALEAFVEQSGNSGLIDRVAVELHRVQGVLRMLEVYGGALLA
jgi:chemosensory pili system protein ChpA (sensor histidine kinase/response regulator)